MVKSCRKLSNYISRIKTGKKYVRHSFYCSICGKKTTKLAFDVFNSKCGSCSINGF